MTGLTDAVIDTAAVPTQLAEEAKRQSGSSFDTLAAGGDTLGLGAVEAVSAAAHGVEAAAATIGESVLAVLGGLLEGLGS